MTADEIRRLASVESDGVFVGTYAVARQAKDWLAEIAAQLAEANESKAQASGKSVPAMSEIDVKLMRLGAAYCSLSGYVSPPLPGGEWARELNAVFPHGGEPVSGLLDRVQEILGGQR